MRYVETKLNAKEVLNRSRTQTPVNETKSNEYASSPLHDNKLYAELAPQMQRHPAFLKPYIPKTYSNDKTAIPNTSDTDEFCSNIGDMMIEPLRKLYQSAHESGRDQLKIKLHMRPISAEFISLVAFPKLSRNDGPEKRKLLMEKQLEYGPAAAFAHINSEYMEDKEVQTTVEMQVWITCLESFQVMDSQTGVVLQGSEDGIAQEVTHVVRFARNVTIGSDRFTRTFDHWKITDIDDMLGHKAWYIV
jgi:hypothetical protein